MQIERTAGCAGRPRTVAQRGAVLLAVLWMSAMVMWIAMAVAGQIRLRGEEERIRYERRLGLYLAAGGVNEALARMTTDIDTIGAEDEEDAWRPNGAVRTIAYSRGLADVSIEEELSKVNVNIATVDSLEDVLLQAGADEGEVGLLAERIVGFRGAEELGAGGTERGLGVGDDQIDFGKLAAVDQLLLIDGIAPELFYGRASAAEDEQGDDGDAFIESGSPLFDLITVYGSNEGEEDQGDLFETDDEDKVYKFRVNETYRIVSTGRLSKQAAGAKLVVIVRLNQASPGGYQILYRKIL